MEFQVIALGLGLRAVSYLVTQFTPGKDVSLIQVVAASTSQPWGSGVGTKFPRAPLFWIALLFISVCEQRVSGKRAGPPSVRYDPLVYRWGDLARAQGWLVALWAGSLALQMPRGHLHWLCPCAI